MTDEFIQMQGLCKVYGEKTALKDLNLKIHRGEFLAVVGSSGAGKTTLLRLLDLLEDPTRGKIMVDGFDIAATSEHERLAFRRRIGMVFQKTVLFNASVVDNVAYPLRVRGVKKGIAQEVDDALEQVGLGGFENRNATTLSGGEAQRVALAQAMITRPDLLLLDEPTANLDPRNTKTIESIVAGIGHDNGVTIIMATHNMRQARNLCSMVATLEEGELLRLGTPEELVKTSPENLAL